MTLVLPSVNQTPPPPSDLPYVVSYYGQLYYRAGRICDLPSGTIYCWPHAVLVHDYVYWRSK
jgi:hypothetical protein